MHFTSLKLCRSFQIPHLLHRVTSTSDLNALNHTTLLAIWMRKSSKTLGETQGILVLTSFPHSFDQLQKQKDKTLDSSSVLILFSYTWNKKKNPSPRKIRLSRVTNNRAVAHKCWMTRYSPCPL